MEHNAILKASIRREGYIASGVGAVLCARHALVRKNGTGDLQLGERWFKSHDQLAGLFTDSCAATGKLTWTTWRLERL